MSECTDGGSCVNTDVHLWPQTSAPDAPQVAVYGVTDTAIGIQVGGVTIVQPIKSWHAMVGLCVELAEALERASESINVDFSSNHMEDWQKSRAALTRYKQLIGE